MNHFSAGRLLLGFSVVLSVSRPYAHAAGRDRPLSIAGPEQESPLQSQKRADELLYSITSSAPGPGRIIKGKPFCADAVTETLPESGSSDRITRKNVMRECRDRDGRTRREQTLQTLGPSLAVAPRTMIFLSDPVQNVNYVLDPKDKVARKFSYPASAAVVSPELGAPAPSRNPMDLQTASLGSRMIRGLLCIGTRRTKRMAAGQTGKELPMVAETESWFSDQIEEIVQSVTRDLRFGTIRYQLRNIERHDPPAELFTPSPNYRVESMNNAGERTQGVSPNR